MSDLTVYNRLSSALYSATYMCMLPSSQRRASGVVAIYSWGGGGAKSQTDRHTERQNDRAINILQPAGSYKIKPKTQYNLCSRHRPSNVN